MCVQNSVLEVIHIARKKINVFGINITEIRKIIFLFDESRNYLFGVKIHKFMLS